MTAATLDETRHQRSIDDIAIFLPHVAREALQQAVKLLGQADLDLNAYISKLLTVGEALIERGLDTTIDASEALIERLYQAGVMERLGNLNAFLRDGAEIGIQVSLNTLKALEPSDVAILLGIVLVAWLAPNLLLLNSSEFLAIGSTLLAKLWNLP